MPFWTNLKKNPSFYFYLMVKLVALVFYENDFFNLHATLTAVNLHLEKINRKIIPVCFFDWRQFIAAFCSNTTHLHGVLGYNCRRRTLGSYSLCSQSAMVEVTGIELYGMSA